MGTVEQCPGLVDSIAGGVESVGGGPVLGRGNMYSWAGAGARLASLQSYRPGWMAGQQHAWQLTLDPARAGAVFTTQPTNTGEREYWVGGVLPRLAQHRNTLLALYSPAPLLSIVFNTSITHGSSTVKLVATCS